MRLAHDILVWNSADAAGVEGLNSVTDFRIPRRFSLRIGRCLSALKENARESEPLVKRKTHRVLGDLLDRVRHDGIVSEIV
ncbi:MAG TPA: hypothetical protein VK993_10425 [Chthoniobacterales bacterium]|nr:hypothetical protein [Chthoniobacterales bacterium]